ncbi:MAG: hypothetical protein HY909_31750 [Deltaproteobacteria bacterium]|nr:hypothetical protein [Deltaproteobacteria bacterium]
MSLKHTLLALLTALVFSSQSLAQPAQTGTSSETPGDTSSDTSTDTSTDNEGEAPRGGRRGGTPTAPALSAAGAAAIGALPGDVAAWPDPDRNVHRTLIPPFFLYERSGGRRTTVVFPFFFRDRRGDRTALFIPPYYRLRSPTVQADVLFPLWFHWRGQDPGPQGERWGTHIIPPVYWSRWQGAGEAHGLALGVAPLFMYGESWGQDGALRREHLVIPPLLTFHTWTPERAVSVAGPFYYNRSGADTDWGLAPLWFAGNNPNRSYLAIPLALTYHRENHDTDRALTVVGPFWVDRSPGSLSLNLAPVLFHRHDATSTRTTLLPLFHYGRSPRGVSLVTPLAVYDRTGEATTLVTPVYQQHRGSTNWDAVAPFFFSSREAATGAHTEALLPLFYHRWTPSRNTWWLLPTIHSVREGDDWTFNIYPLLFAGRSGERRHTVVAPLFWRFESPSHVTQLVANVLWLSSERQGVRSYQWHVLPLFSYGRPRPEDLDWNVLFGLVGYRRLGGHKQLRLFWIRFDV